MTASTDPDDPTASTIAAVRRLDAAVNDHDLDAVMAAMTDDVVFETTFPAPDGTRHEGAASVRAALREFFDGSPHAHFETEELFACGERATLRWTYRWVEADGTRGHVRGVDVLRVRDGLVSETLGYVKG